MSKLKNYTVVLPVTGSLYVEVKAESEEAAIEKAFEKDLTVDMLEDWNVHREICQGNVFHGEQNEAYAEENK